MREDETGTRIDIEFEPGQRIGNVHAQNRRSGAKNVLFRYPENPSEYEIEQAIEGCDIFQRAYNLKKRETMTYLKGQIKKALNMMTTFAETGHG